MPCPCLPLYKELASRLLVEETELKRLALGWALPVLLLLPGMPTWASPEPRAARPSAARPALSARSNTVSPIAASVLAPAQSPSQPAAGGQAAPAAPAPAVAALAADAAEPAVPATPEERIKALEERVQQLLDRIDQLEKKQAPPAPEAPAPPPEAPTEPTAPTETPPAPTGGATLLPNISAIGNFKFAGSDSKGTAGRGKFRLAEFEIGLQDRVAPNLRLDAFLSSEQAEGWRYGVEEAYLTWTNPLGVKSLSTRIGKQRTPFGKLNPQHPHTWLYVTQPSVITALLGPDGLNSDGILGQYLVPIGGNFLNLELGRWETASQAEDGLGFAGGQKGAYSGRLWFGKEVGRDRELELGLSHYNGSGDVQGIGHTRLQINGLDFTFRSYPAAYQRLLLQGELIQHSTGGFNAHPRVGGYLTLAKRFNQYYEGGLRGDYTRYPYPTPGHESAASLFLTRFITEQTAVRLELRHGARPEDGGFNEAWLQILTGFGPHSHNLQ